MVAQCIFVPPDFVGESIDPGLAVLRSLWMTGRSPTTASTTDFDDVSFYGYRKRWGR